ncbi:MAG: hypothetical protein A2428_13060 [Bdellovibrionales bacterium RIFOXYC1_FULL_54_43]|nr:MAG: hypothetical protein A2428_13060 [Bdellovibrionales bacterium RIFOXYC1_FULL_54_43]OFZ83857.1 MAG: hypothetical protein A2603_09000 [Bdellovibrionales bacterium RIFOXYD1_FULL_55_31]
MGIERLISVVALLAVLAVSTGQLQRILNTVRVAQLQLIRDSQASKWGRAMLLETERKRME